MAETVLVTTHDLEVAIGLRDALTQEGFRVELLTPSERIADYPEATVVVITGGLEEKRARRLLREARAAGELPVIGLADSAAAAGDTAHRLGLTDVVRKPVESQEVALLTRRVIERRQLRLATGIIGETERMREVLERVIQIAPVNATVLLTGESGTGKELVARGLHALSRRRDRRFLAANVAALPETLLESELFGHEKGAFTGAVAQRKGLFELADHGTLFLDEIGEMPLPTQTKLLRVLEDRQFMRVGGEQAIRVDVRVIAATNRDLRELIELGEFRRDLYYRLNVLTVELPALRERRADIPLLLDAFLQEFASEHGRRVIGLTPDALAALQDYAWPGNVRELRNLVESLVVLTHGPAIDVDDLPDYVRAGSRRPMLLPAPRPSREVAADTRMTAPELEFVFRTLVQQRLDLDDLRRDFDEYRRHHRELPPATSPIPHWVGELSEAAGRAHDDDIDDAEVVGEAAAAEIDGVVVYRPGQTMEDLERAAILAALREVAGNRRKAAEMLGIGERTLYRKIKEYGITV
ncbi:MAG: sigma-54 interaction domain-containing protein [Longimicrobiales bacterium]